MIIAKRRVSFSRKFFIFRFLKNVCCLQVRLLRIEKIKKEEAERLHREEEERLRRQMREVEAKREAEKHHQERLKKIEEDKQKEEEKMKALAKDVTRREEEARQRRDMPVEDSKVVEEMFGFLGDQTPGEIDSS